MRSSRVRPRPPPDALIGAQPNMRLYPTGQRAAESDDARNVAYT